MTGESGIYAIKLKGCLDDHWSEWFEGFAMVHDEGGNTILTGSISDQAALHGLLMRIRDLGLPLLAVERIEEDS